MTTQELAQKILELIEQFDNESSGKSALERSGAMLTVIDRIEDLCQEEANKQ